MKNINWTAIRWIGFAIISFTLIGTLFAAVLNYKFDYYHYLLIEISALLFWFLYGLFSIFFLED